jgi:pre-mRNA-splicing factor ATP-dependent RNA helicase DHX15/PRP43
VPNYHGIELAPAPETVVMTLEILQLLRAIGHDGKLSSRGKELAAIPTNVYAALSILEGSQFGCSDEIISVMAVVEATYGGGSVYRNAQNEEQYDKLRTSKHLFQHPAGDHLTLFNIYMAWRAARSRGDLDTRTFLNDHMLDSGMLRSADGHRLKYLEAVDQIEFWSKRELPKNDPNYYTRLLQALAARHYLHTAKRNPLSNDHQLVRSGMEVSLDNKTTLNSTQATKHNKWVIYNDCSDNSTNKCLRIISSIAPQLLVAAQPEYWWDAEFLPGGHIKDGLLQTLANMKKGCEEG